LRQIGAANRFPDSVEADPQAAQALNVESTRFLTSEAQKRNILLIYISTDYVFPGRPGEAPYKVTDKPDPPNAYGRTKHEGEEALLKVSSTSEKVTSLVLRVPLLYGHCEENDKGKSAVHPLVDAVYKASRLGAEDAKIKVDDYALRFPTCTEDVGRIIVEIANRYLNQKDGEELPRILQFSSEQKYTKWEMTKVLAEILGLPVDKLEPHDPTKDQAEGATQRPYDSHLDTSALKELGISVATSDFVGWW
jgi:S-adenosylmethionine synthetase